MSVSVCVCVLCGQMAMEIEDFSVCTASSSPLAVHHRRATTHVRKGPGRYTFSAHAQNIHRGRIKRSCQERCSDSRVLSFLEMTFCDQAYSDLAFEWLNDSTTANYVREYDYSWRPVKLSTKDDI